MMIVNFFSKTSLRHLLPLNVYNKICNRTPVPQRINAQDKPQAHQKHLAVGNSSLNGKTNFLFFAMTPIKGCCFVQFVNWPRETTHLLRDVINSKQMPKISSLH
jgi:hypothetical protein